MAEIYWEPQDELFAVSDGPWSVGDNSVTVALKATPGAKIAREDSSNSYFVGNVHNALALYATGFKWRISASTEALRLLSDHVRLSCYPELPEEQMQENAP